jgi:endoglucanase
MAALFLAWATNSSDYYSQAETYYAQYSLREKDAVFNWDSKTPGLAVLFAQLANSGANFAGNLSGWQAESERYFDRIVNGGGPSFKTKGAKFFLFPRMEDSRGLISTGGLLWYPGDSDSDSLNPALNAAMLLARYAQIATTEDKSRSYLVRLRLVHHVAPLPMTHSPPRTSPGPNSIMP